VTVLDTLAPVITLNGGNPIYVELGSTFTDPGATATDLCLELVPVTVSGLVNPNSVGTNLLTYTATDGNGNTNVAARTVIVRAPRRQRFRGASPTWFWRRIRIAAR